VLRAQLRREEGSTMIQKTGPLLAALVLLAAAHPPPPANRTSRDAVCRASESGPALRVEVLGLKDQRGVLRLELYPANNDDYLASEKELLAAGKVFRRVELAVPAQADPVLCIRAPQAGRYAVAVVHDRDANGKFSPFTDGVTAPGTIPNLGRGRPRVSDATVTVGEGVSRATARMQYLRGLGFAPLR
jgi:uncharacterized protein (DUF2141 family)